MKFSSDRQPAPERRSGGKSPMYTKIVRAIEKRFVGGVDGADTFEEWLVYKAISDGGVYLQEMLRRISPMHKPTLEPIEIDFPADGTPVQKANAVLDAMANGEIAPDVGNIFIEAISRSLGIEELTELAKRLEAIEKILDAKTSN